MVPSGRILLLDDSPAQCELLEQALARHGLARSLQVEHTLECALACLEHRTGGEAGLPCLILVDLKMTHGGGIAFIRRLRADPRWAGVPVVILTTSDDPSDVQASYAAGANSYLVKPPVFDDLVTLAGDLCRYWLGWNLSVASARHGAGVDGA